VIYFAFVFSSFWTALCLFLGWRAGEKHAWADKSGSPVNVSLIPDRYEPQKPEEVSLTQD